MGADPFDFSQRQVLVTGAAHGFGRAICQAFSARGTRVIACDIQEQELMETASLCGDNCQAELLDVTDQAAVERLFSQSNAAHWQIDTLINNAGGVMGQQGQALESVTLKQWHCLQHSSLAAQAKIKSRKRNVRWTTTRWTTNRFDLVERVAFLPVIPHQFFLAFGVIDPRSLLHLQHSFCLHRI